MLPDRFAAAPTKSPVGVGVVSLVVVSQATLMLSAALGWRWPFLAAVVLGLLADELVARIPAVALLFNRAQINAVARALVREVGFVVLVARWGGLEDLRFVTVALAAFSIPVMRGALLFLATPLRRRIQRPVEVDNVALAGLGPEPHEVPMPTVPTSVRISTVALVAGCVAVIAGWWWMFLVVVTGYVLLFGGWGIWALLALVRARAVAPRDTYLRHAMGAVQGLRPQAVLYFSGPVDAVYQVNMWLPVMERIGRPVLVVLRERANLSALAPTSLPVVVVPAATDLMNFRLPSVRAAFYVSHVGKNIHLQREPRMKHVFIGHGESDKVASINPITKGFDEVWVAGRVSRERWANARVGVRDESIVEVGRPQLGGITEAEPRVGRPLSVLYAPTWEGWTKDPYTSSVPTMGVEMVRWLLARPDTRLIYKPHPFTGSVSTRARAANEAIIAMVRGSERGGVLATPATAEAWDGVSDRHLVIAANEATLYACFNRSDVLIGDISSVVPDYLATGKPYAVPNPAGRDHEVIRSELASTRGAYLMDRDPDTWEALLSDAAGPDSMEQTRSKLRLALLGPWHADPVEPWREALDDLLCRANAEWPDAAREAASTGGD